MVGGSCFKGYARSNKRNHHMKKPNPVVTRLDRRRTQVSCGDQSTIVLEDWGSPPDFMVDWTVEGIRGYWPNLQSAINAARDQVRDRYDPLRDLVRRVCHGESTLPWVALHDFDGDHQFPELLAKTSDGVKMVLEDLLNEEPLTLDTISRASVRKPSRLIPMDGYVHLFRDPKDESRVVVSTHRMLVHFWAQKVHELSQNIECMDYEQASAFLHDAISPYLVVTHYNDGIGSLLWQELVVC